MPVQWSVLIQPLDEPEPWLSIAPERVLRTASVGKCLLLSEVARRLADGSLDGGAALTWEKAEFVRDSGLWHAMDQRTLTVLDACRLVGALSDNLATNVLLRLVGVDAVTDLAERHQLAPMALLDRVRDERDPSQPGVAETLSRASAQAVVRWLRLVHKDVLDRRVLDWLALGTDLSMVASAFGLDPLAHAEADRGVRLVNKTGTDSSVRADVGLVTVAGRTVAYAAIANWERRDNDSPATDPRDEVLAAMRRFGTDLRTRLSMA